MALQHKRLFFRTIPDCSLELLQVKDTLKQIEDFWLEYSNEILTILGINFLTCLKGKD